ncbi:MAG TPA: shikimate kinase [Candidatus Acidoferrales bacterium]|nr:shikimate kinase [Candidatus Acidoferrales bacterium]
MKRHVALIGFMAAGKSTIGKRLARELGLPFVDTDAEIIAAHGPIEEIFAREGEAAFREYERAAVEAALLGETKVVSLGGGAVTHAPTRDLLTEHTVRVFVEVPATTILARSRRSQTPRPLLGEKPSLARIRELLALREPLYREAEIVIDGRGATSKVARAIALELRSALRPR